jgi:hypothetical protein
MNGTATILYVSEIGPAPTHASAVVIRRHLLALERAGFAICVVALQGTVVDPPPSWRILELPARKPYYPPYRRFGPLRLARWWLFDREVMPVLRGLRVHCVLGLLHGDYLSRYAAWLARRLDRPLCYFYHDRGEHLAHHDDPAAAARLTRENHRLLGSSRVRHVWAVSRELAVTAAPLRVKFSVVYPLPERLNDLPSPAWRTSFATAPVLAHSGTIYNEIVPYLRAIAAALGELGGTLLLTSPRADVARDLEKEFPLVVTYAGDIPDPRRMAALLHERASAFLVVYPPDSSHMPWSADSFPSKLVQLVHTRLPGIVLAPSSTSVSRWCVRANWTLHSPTMDRDSLAGHLARLRRPDEWRAAAAESERAAKEEFSPDGIETKVNRDILSL